MPGGVPISPVKPLPPTVTTGRTNPNVRRAILCSVSQVSSASSKNQDVAASNIAWSSSTAYTATQVVFYQGQYWQCLTGNTNSAPGPTNTKWSLTAAPNPSVCSVFIENHLPERSGYSIPANFGQVWPAGTTNFAWKDSNGNARSQTVSGPYSCDPSSKTGGSWILVDTKTKSVIQLLQGVSQTSPSDTSVTVNSHTHSGGQDIWGNPLPPPIDLTNETQGSLPQSKLAANPSPNTAPVVSGTPTITYPYATSSIYDAYVNFALTYPSGYGTWLAEIRVYTTLHGATFDLSTAVYRQALAVKSGGNYKALLSNMHQGTQDDVYVLYVDGQGVESTPALLGPTTAYVTPTGHKGGAPMPTGPKPTPVVSSISGSITADNAATFDWGATFHLDSVGYYDNSDWLLEIELFASLQGKTVYRKVGSIAPQASGSPTYSGVWGGLGEGDSYDLVLCYKDYQGQRSNFSTIFATVQDTGIGTKGYAPMPTAIKTNGPTISSMSVTRTSTKGSAHRLEATFTETDFTAPPYWLKRIWLVLRNHGDTDGNSDHKHHHEIAIDPSDSSSGTYDHVLRGHAGTAHDVGVAYQDHTGAWSKITWHANGSNIADANGDLFDTTDGYSTTYNRTHKTIRNVIDSGSNILNVEFPGTKLSPDGSLIGWSNAAIGGTSSTETFPLVNGQPFHVSAVLQVTGTTYYPRIYIGDGTNGYKVQWNGSSGGNYIALNKCVGGVGTQLLNVGAKTLDTGPHTLSITVTPGATTNTIEVSVDDITGSWSDNSLTLTSGTWPVTIGSNDANLKVRHIVIDGGQPHHTGMSKGVQAALDSSGNGLSVQFTGTKCSVADDTITGVNNGQGNFAVQTRTYGAGEKFVMRGKWKVASGTPIIRGGIANGTNNGYVINMNSTGFTLAKIVNGAGTGLATIQSVTGNTNWHSFEITVTCNGASSNTIEASVDNYAPVIVYNDASFDLTTGSWGAYLFDANNGTTKFSDIQIKGAPPHRTQAHTDYQNTVISGGGIDFASALHHNKILDNIADGTTYGRHKLDGLTNGYSTSTWDGTTKHNVKGVGDAQTLSLDSEIADGTTYNRLKASSMTGNDFDFAKGGVNKILDNIGDGSSYKRVAAADITSGHVTKTGATGSFTIKGVGDTNTLSLDTEIADGTSYKRVVAGDISSGHVTKTYDGTTSRNIKGVGDSQTLSLDSEIADGTTYNRLKASSMTSNDFDFAKGGVNKVLDNIADGTTYGRHKLDGLLSGYSIKTASGGGSPTVTEVQSVLAVSSYSGTLGVAPTNGNLLVAYGFNNNANPGINTGWTQVGAYVGNCCVAWKIAGSGESTTQTPFTGSATNDTVIVEFNSTTGWPVNPVDTNSILHSTSPGSPPSITCTATPSQTYDLAVMGTWAYSRSTVGAPTAAPTGMTSAQIINGATGANGYGLVAYQLSVGTTSSTSYTANWPSGTSTDANGLLVFFTPNAGGFTTYSTKGVGDTQTLSLDNEIADGSTYGRVKGSELSSGTVKQLNDGTNVRTAGNVATAIDSSGRHIGTLYDGTNSRSMANITTAIDSSGRHTGTLYDGTNSRSMANVTTALDGSGRIIGSIYDGTNSRTPSDVTGTVLSGGGIDFSSSKHTHKTMQYIADDTLYSKVVTGDITSNRVSQHVATPFSGVQQNIDGSLSGFTASALTVSANKYSSGTALIVSADFMPASSTEIFGIWVGDNTQQNGYLLRINNGATQMYRYNSGTATLVTGYTYATTITVLSGTFYRFRLAVDRAQSLVEAEIEDPVGGTNGVAYLMLPGGSSFPTLSSSGIYVGVYVGSTATKVQNLQVTGRETWLAACLPYQNAINNNYVLSGQAFNAGVLDMTQGAMWTGKNLANVADGGSRYAVVNGAGLNGVNSVDGTNRPNLVSSFIAFGGAANAGIVSGSYGASGGSLPSASTYPQGTLLINTNGGSGYRLYYRNGTPGWTALASF